MKHDTRHPRRGRGRRRCAALVVSVALGLGGVGHLAVAAFAPAFARDIGSGNVVAKLDGGAFEFFTYHPSGCAAPSVLLVFHGNGRTAQSYRDSARDIADRGCFVVYVPLFDEDRFPNWSYHRGGVALDGELREREDWTTDFVSEIIEWVRRREDDPEAPVFVFGHSAGGQYLSRVAAYSLPRDVERIVIANPSTYVLPSATEDAPYGFGLLSEAQALELMRAYLAAPVTLFLGTDDTGEADLTMTDAAVRQGENRLARGEATFEAARRVAEDHGWEFGWQLVHADDVGHTARGMLTAPEIFEALGFPDALAP